jgi:DNA-binding Lrp family transcriptional regulator
MLFNNIDRKLLDIIQDEFPLTIRPYQEIALLLDISEDDVMERLKKLKEDGIIRRMGAIFDSKKIGYFSTLCAMETSPQQVESVAQLINEYPGVTHNYLRNDKYNMWFTITARSQNELDGIMGEIREKSGIQNLISLPAVRTFKINVRFSMLDEETQEQNPKIQDKASVQELTEQEKRIVRELQEDISLCYKPFQAIALNLGIAEEDLLTKVEEFKERGVIRRFSAVLRHRNVGIVANAMGVWCVPEEKAERVGAIMASFPQVSHCYQRVKQHNWPYNVYTMIHGKTTEDCEHVAKKISQDTGITDYRLLYSTRELKKSSMKYFAKQKD